MPNLRPPARRMSRRRRLTNARPWPPRRAILDTGLRGEPALGSFIRRKMTIRSASAPRLRSEEMMAANRRFELWVRMRRIWGSISHVSPLARGMFGKRVGDTVGAGTGEAEILSISFNRVFGDG